MKRNLTLFLWRFSQRPYARPSRRVQPGRPTLAPSPERDSIHSGGRSPTMHLES